MILSVLLCPPPNESLCIRGRRKTSQKLAKLDRLRKANFKRKKNELKVDYARCAPPVPAANRVELDRAATLIENSFSIIFGSVDTVILTLPIISPSRLFLSYSDQAVNTN